MDEKEREGGYRRRKSGARVRERKVCGFSNYLC